MAIASFINEVVVASACALASMLVVSLISAVVDRGWWLAVLREGGVCYCAVVFFILMQGGTAVVGWCSKCRYGSLCLVLAYGYEDPVKD